MQTFGGSNLSAGVFFPFFYKELNFYASVGGATGHTVVGLCICVCMYLSVCRQDFSSLAENKALKRATQAKVNICLKMNCKDFGYKALFVSYSVIAYLAMAGWRSSC